MARVGALCVGLLLVSSGVAHAEVVEMSPASGSKINFTAHQKFSSTNGTFKAWTGTFAIDRADLGQSKIAIKIDASSIDTDSSKRDEHLRNEDFFHVSKFPHVTFRSTSVRQGKGVVQVEGVLRVKDKDTKVTLNLALKDLDGGKVRARGQISVSRKKLGLNYEAPFYIPSIKDRVNIALDVTLAPK